MNRETHDIWLMGGLGNQAFQINQGLYLQKLGLNINFVDNLLRPNFFSKNLLNWSFHGKYCEDIFGVTTSTKKNIFPAVTAKIFPTHYSFFYKNFLNNLDDRLAKNLFGYFQSNLTMRDVVLELPKNRGSSDKNGKYVIHLRFGDAVRPAENYTYYVKALHLAKKKYSGNIWTIATDDIPKAKELLEEIGGIQYQFHNGSVVDDFILLCKCEKIICSDSTFSWWGAQLNKGVSTIIAPTSLFNDLPSFGRRCQIIQIGRPE